MATCEGRLSTSCEPRDYAGCTGTAIAPFVDRSLKGASNGYVVANNPRTHHRMRWISSDRKQSSDRQQRTFAGRLCHHGRHRRLMYREEKPVEAAATYHLNTDETRMTVPDNNSCVNVTLV